MTSPPPRDPDTFDGPDGLAGLDNRRTAVPPVGTGAGAARHATRGKGGPRAWAGAAIDVDVAEILRQVQRVQIVANRAVNEMFAGQYKSVFRGRGMEFDEVREYQPGDDIRDIDWNVTARSSTCYIKRYSEERELTVQFLVDTSASGLFGSASRSKLELMVEVVALLMFSALKSSDKVGLLTFADGIQQFFPARKGKSHVLRLIRELVGIHPRPAACNVEGALQYLNRVQKRRAVVFLVSDFLGVEASHALRVAKQRHDLSAITISDPRERELPNVGLLRLQGAESGQRVEIDTGSRRVRERFASQAQAQQARVARMLRRAGVDQLPLSTETDYLAQLRRFFSMREQRVH